MCENATDLLMLDEAEGFKKYIQEVIMIHAF